MAAEVMLREEIELTKRRIHGKDPVFERLRAYITTEGDKSQDYQLVCRFGEM